MTYAYYSIERVDSLLLFYADYIQISARKMQFKNNIFNFFPESKSVFFFSYGNLNKLSIDYQPYSKSTKIDATLLIISYVMFNDLINQ